MGLVVKVLCGHICIACLRPLTRRYASKRKTAHLSMSLMVSLYQVNLN
ncbi:TPA: hypothetical protein I7118_22290 [Vibrio vulnificus]|nr:hypothetical protein [Vibrio vulnificus]